MHVGLMARAGAVSCVGSEAGRGVGWNASACLACLACVYGVALGDGGEEGNQGDDDM